MSTSNFDLGLSQNSDRIGVRSSTVGSDTIVSAISRMLGR